APADSLTAASGSPQDTTSPAEPRLNPALALIPLVPLILLFLTGPPLQLLRVPTEWLVEAPRAGGRIGAGLFDSRLIGAAMLVGVVVATLAVPRKALGVAGAFFEGAGYGFTHIISLIVAANCLGAGVSAVGLADLFRELIEASPWLLLPLAGALPLG